VLGLTLDKIVVIVLVAGLVLGPSRLPGYARRLAGLVRAARRAVDDAGARAQADLGVPLRSTDWSDFDPRRYDPRRIVRDALAEDRGTAAAPADATPAAAPTGGAAPDDRPPVVPAARDEYVIAGTSGHPRRVRAVPGERDRSLGGSASRSEDD
jgi:sec-independent protein translocase protein TatB